MIAGANLSLNFNSAKKNE